MKDGGAANCVKTMEAASHLKLQPCQQSKWRPQCRIDYQGEGGDVSPFPANLSEQKGILTTFGRKNGVEGGL
jgi:hypothetical protein